MQNLTSHVAFVEKKDYGYADSESTTENEGGVGAVRAQADSLLAEALRREAQGEAPHLEQSEQTSSIQGSLALARSQKFPNQRDFKATLQSLVNAFKGNKRDRKRLMRLALNDLVDGLRSNANAVGW